MNVWIIVLVFIVLIILFIVASYNSLIITRNRVKDQFSQIDVQLKKRADLIPNLVETVKGYTKHEEEIFKNAIAARKNYLSSNSKNDKIKSNSDIDNTINKLFALTENYPDLKASTNFQNLQTQLKEIEDKIAYARQFYNDTVLLYNNRVEMFPSNIIANIFNFKQETFFEASEKDKENIKVKF